MFWDPDLTLPKFSWPKNQPYKNLLFASGLWLGGIDKSDGNKIITSVQTYRAGLRNFWSVPILVNQNPDTSKMSCKI